MRVYECENHVLGCMHGKGESEEAYMIRDLRRPKQQSPTQTNVYKNDAMERVNEQTIWQDRARKWITRIMNMLINETFASRAHQTGIPNQRSKPLENSQFTIITNENCPMAGPFFFFLSFLSVASFP